MYLISMNIRGMGGSIKTKYMGELIKKEQAGWVENHYKKITNYIQILFTYGFFPYVIYIVDGIQNQIPSVTKETLNFTPNKFFSIIMIFIILIIINNININIILLILI